MEAVQKEIHFLFIKELNADYPMFGTSKPIYIYLIVKNQIHGTPLFIFKKYLEYKDSNTKPHELEEFSMSTIPEIAQGQSELLKEITEYITKRIDTNGKIITY